jgi:hypothetical protein
MPHLHLPIDHTEADLVLASNLAEVVGSEDLYVAWSHEAGPGVIPEVEAVVREDHPMSLLSEFMTAMGAACAAFWRAFLGRSEETARYQDADSGAGRASVR